MDQHPARDPLAPCGTVAHWKCRSVACVRQPPWLTHVREPVEPRPMRADEPPPPVTLPATSARAPEPAASESMPTDAPHESSAESQSSALPASFAPPESSCDDGAAHPPLALPEPSLHPSRPTAHWRAPHHRNWQACPDRHPVVGRIHVWLTTRRVLPGGTRVDFRDPSLR